jgi:hypothetical protein
VQRELLEWELRSARRLWPGDVHIQTRLISEYLKRSVTEYQQPNSQPSLEQCVAIPTTWVYDDRIAAYHEQQQQQFAKAVIARMSGWKYSAVHYHAGKQCTALAKQYWPAVYVQWHEDIDREKLEIQLLSARLWWPNDVMLQTVLIQQYLRDSIYTKHQPIRSSSDAVCVAIP